jgi:SAM-dependent methyltransferase
MHHDPPDTAALFAEQASWETYAQNPYLQERTRIVLKMIPDDVHTVLDVGCGNGILVHALAAQRPAVGIDPSLAALRMFSEPRAAGIGERLPVRSAGVDLACCLEVLEHLPDPAVDACSRELMRVARRWLLVGTPDSEDPRRNALRCPQCGRVFNRNHHLQRFDEPRLRHLFGGFELQRVQRCGQPVRAYPRPLLWARHRVARRFFKGPGETRGLCPQCGNREFPPFRPNLLSFLLDGTNRLISPRRPYWILALFKRRQDGSIGASR